ncbi:esterase C25G4.2-like [Impatiens glandulifera]|uniref:esterase C25G4.2-like n=1 Tax=Impatiens glandulifera TaxID=253017 RepID=UPI001FB0977B|nr:esterase C25G4.2-like [Impatiens glandulifera]
MICRPWPPPTIWSEKKTINGHRFPFNLLFRPIHRPFTPVNQSADNRGQTIEMENNSAAKPRVLCLHGYRTSGEILKKQIFGAWSEKVTSKLDLVFLDGPNPARGKSEAEGFCDPPYYEWYHANEGFTEYYHFEECISYIEDYMIKHGPFDGLLGFSQGALLSAAFPGMQLNGVALTGVPNIKFVILVSGAIFGGLKLFGSPKLAANAFSSPIRCSSLHIIGEMDFLKEKGIELLDSFVEPTVIHHPKGHIVPRLDEKNMEIMLGFIEKIEKLQ